MSVSSLSERPFEFKCTPRPIPSVGAGVGWGAVTFPNSFILRCGIWKPTPSSTPPLHHPAWRISAQTQNKASAGPDQSVFQAETPRMSSKEPLFPGRTSHPIANNLSAFRCVEQDSLTFLLFTWFSRQECCSAVPCLSPTIWPPDDCCKELTRWKRP